MRRKEWMSCPVHSCSQVLRYAQHPTIAAIHHTFPPIAAFLHPHPHSPCAALPGDASALLGPLPLSCAHAAPGREGRDDDWPDTPGASAGAALRGGGKGWEMRGC